MGVEQEPSRQEELREVEEGLSEEEKDASTEVEAYRHAVELESTLWRLGETIKRSQEQLARLKWAISGQVQAFRAGRTYIQERTTLDDHIQSEQESRGVPKREDAIKAKKELEAELRAESSNAEWQPAPAEDGPDAAPAEPPAEAEEPAKE